MPALTIASSAEKVFQNFVMDSVMISAKFYMGMKNTALKKQAYSFYSLLYTGSRLPYMVFFSQGLALLQPHLSCIFRR
jgi:hypothetical protein